MREEHCFIQDALPSLVDFYAKLTLSADSDITGGDEDVEESRAFVKETDALGLNGKGYNWTVPLGHVPLSTFVRYMMHFLANLFKDATVLKILGTFLYRNGLTSDGVVLTA